jgi:DnaK suppressor protein
MGTGDPAVSLEESLRIRRDELAAELGRLTEPPEAGATVGFGKRVGDGTTEAVERISTTLTARSIAASLAEVDRALEKLAEGSYGRCDDCGQEIAAARLEAMPAKVNCVDCAGRQSSGRVVGG